jgi:hypothetical protein
MDRMYALKILTESRPPYYYAEFTSRQEVEHAYNIMKHDLLEGWRLVIVYVEKLPGWELKEKLTWRDFKEVEEPNNTVGSQ